MTKTELEQSNEEEKISSRKKHPNFNKIKNQNGVEFAYAIQKNCQGVFKVDDIVDIVKYAGQDPEPIMPYLVSLLKIKIEPNGPYEPPEKLLERAGYDTYYVNTPEEETLLEEYRKSGNVDAYKKLKKTMLDRQNSFMKYYAVKEELCTFRDGKNGNPYRFEENYVIFAVSKDVDKIKREDYEGKEEEKDEYSRSVLSIQIQKRPGFGGCRKFFIIGRYNHGKKNQFNTPNTLFNNQPDDIIPGLAQSLKDYFKVDFSSHTEELPENFKLVGDQIIKYNYCWKNYRSEYRDEIFYGTDFYVKDNIIYPLKKSEKKKTPMEFMLDTCILNVTDGTLFEPQEYDKPKKIKDIVSKLEWHAGSSLLRVLAGEFKGKKITFTDCDKDGCRSICADGIPIVKVRDGKITGLNLPTTKTIGKNFLSVNETLEEFNAPELEEVGDQFLEYDIALKEFNAPNLRIIGNSCMRRCEKLSKLNLPNVITIGNKFLEYSKKLKEIFLPKVVEIGNFFLSYNNLIEKLDLPQVRKINNYFFGTQYEKTGLKEFTAPNLEEVGEGFLSAENAIKKLNLPKVKGEKVSFLIGCKQLKEFIAPNVPEDSTVRHMIENRKKEAERVAAQKEKQHLEEEKSRDVLNKDSQIQLKPVQKQQSVFEQPPTETELEEVATLSGKDKPDEQEDLDGISGLWDEIFGKEDEKQNIEETQVSSENINATEETFETSLLAEDIIYDPELKDILKAQSISSEKQDVEEKKGLSENIKATEEISETSQLSEDIPCDSEFDLKSILEARSTLSKKENPKFMPQKTKARRYKQKTSIFLKKLSKVIKKGLG